MSDSLWPHDCSPPGFSVLGISQARILGWVAISSSRGSSQSGDWTHISCIGRKILYHWATWKAHTDTWKRKLILGMGSHAYGSPEVPPSALCKLEAQESQGCKSGQVLKLQNRSRRTRRSQLIRESDFTSFGCIQAPSRLEAATHLGEGTCFTLSPNSDASLFRSILTDMPRNHILPPFKASLSLVKLVPKINHHTKQRQ